MQEANRRGAEEALMCNYRGELAECSQSNFFMVRDGVVLTPPIEAGLLEGITRAFLFELGARGRDRGAGRGAASRGSRHGGRGVHHQHDARAQPGGADRRPRRSAAASRGRSRCELLEGATGRRALETTPRRGHPPSAAVRLDAVAPASAEGLLYDLPPRTPRSADTRRSDCGRRTDCRSAPPSARTSPRARYGSGYAACCARIGMRPRRRP